MAQTQRLLLEDCAVYCDKKKNEAELLCEKIKNMVRDTFGICSVQGVGLNGQSRSIRMMRMLHLHVNTHKLLCFLVRCL